MKLEKLGYTSKWIKFNLLNEELFNTQLAELEADAECDVALLRYNTFMKWFASKEKITDKEINNFLLLAHEETDQIMAGNAVTRLFSSALISDEQFDYLKLKLPEFGDWTIKLISRESLTRRLVNEELTFKLYEECLEYKRTFDDNRLLIIIINQTTDEKILADFEENGVGKRIRKLAQKRLNQLKREK